MIIYHIPFLYSTQPGPSPTSSEDWRIMLWERKAEGSWTWEYKVQVMARVQTVLKTRKLNLLILCYLQTLSLFSSRKLATKIIFSNKTLNNSFFRKSDQQKDLKGLVSETPPKRTQPHYPTEKPHKLTEELKIQILVFNS